MTSLTQTLIGGPGILSLMERAGWSKSLNVGAILNLNSHLRGLTLNLHGLEQEFSERFSCRF